jgi:hypothetical protein
VPTLPVLADGTAAKKLADNLTALTKVDDLRKLATLSSDEECRLISTNDNAKPRQRSCHSTQLLHYVHPLVHKIRLERLPLPKFLTSSTSRGKSCDFLS